MTEQAATRTFDKGTYVIHPGTGPCLIGDSEEVTAGGSTFSSVRLHVFGSDRSVLVPAAKIAERTLPLPTAKVIDDALVILRTPGTKRLNSQAGAAKWYAKARSWDVTEMARALAVMQPTYNEPTGSNHALGEAIAAVERLAILRHLVKGEDFAAARLQVAAAARLPVRADSRAAQAPEIRPAAE